MEGEALSEPVWGLSAHSCGRPSRHECDVFLFCVILKQACAPNPPTTHLARAEPVYRAILVPCGRAGCWFVVGFKPYPTLRFGLFMLLLFKIRVDRWKREKQRSGARRRPAVCVCFFFSPSASCVLSFALCRFWRFVEFSRASGRALPPPLRGLQGGTNPTLFCFASRQVK